MNDQKVELDIYQECLYEINRRIDVINEHLDGVINEKLLVVEAETVCLQFRKILEMIALISLVANKDLYAKQHEKFAKHYNARLIMKDLERINLDFYPVPVKNVKHPDKRDELIEIENGYLTKDELVEIYEKCGGMMHAQNPFSTEKPVIDIMKSFHTWLEKICALLTYHKITLVGGEKVLVAIMKRSDNGMPQAVLFKKER